jgi:magnesium-protoporphyrin IX monomethyl ester (oxidative) cyclase
MRVLLIYPPGLATDKTREFLSVGQPLGIAYLGACLERAGFEVHLLDALTEGFVADAVPGAAATRDEMVRVSRGVAMKSMLGDGFPEGTYSVGLPLAHIEAAIRALKPDVVGISVIFTSVYRLGLRIADVVKSIDPAITTVMGGSHVTVSPLGAISHPTVDYIVTGDGEIAFVELLNALRAQRLPKDIAGVGYKDPTGGVTMNRAELFYDLDELPTPAFHLLPMEKYFRYGAEGRTVKMYTSRGCTFTCSFCSVPVTSQRRFRAHSPERVVMEVEKWIRDFRIEGIMFEDDNMNLNPKRHRRIMECLAEGNYGLKLYARNFRCDIMDLASLRLMKKAGFGTIWITPESGNQRVLDQVVRKKMKLGAIEESVRRIRQADMDIGAAFVIGLPGETRDELRDTVNFAKKLKTMGVGNFWFSIATPIEGTAMYQSAVDQGLIEGMDLDKFSYNQASFDTDQFTAGQLNSLRDDLMGELNAR